MKKKKEKPNEEESKLRLRDESYIYIENYHRFNKPTRFPLRPVTLFVGPNGSGKSSLLNALRIYYKSVKTIQLTAEERKDEFINSIFFRLIRNPKAILTIGREFSNKEYFEFHYCKAGDYIDIESFEYGHIDEGGKKKTIVSFKPLLTDSEYLKNITYYDPVYMFYKSLDGSKPEEIREIKKTNIKYGSLALHQWYVNYISKDFINSFTEDKKFNYELLTCLLFKEDLWTGGMIVYKDDDVIQESPTRIIRRRLITPLDLFVDKLGLSSLDTLSPSEFIETLNLSIDISIDLINKIENLTLEAFVDRINFIPETRELPPEYFEIKSGEIVTDHYSLLKFWNEISKTKSNEKTKNNFINELKSFEIADDVIIKKIGYRKHGHEYYHIFLEYKKTLFTLDNLSSGGKQILPIISSLFNNESIFIIKQPELHLHPRLQMKIPELFVRRFTERLVSKIPKRRPNPVNLGSNWIKNNYVFENYGSSYLNFLIETHSEHIIRKFQLLIANSEYPYFTNKDIAIIYVQPDERTLNSSIKIMELDENGNFIDNWPAGFFDESAELSYALLEAQIKRKN